MLKDLSISQLSLLELNRAVHRYETLRHELGQLFWECTLRCNLGCIHCGSDCKKVDVAPDMPFEDFAKVLDSRPQDVDPSKIVVVTTGGEPLLRRDIVDCGKAIRDRGYRWGMVSNAMLLDAEMAERLVANGLDTLAISYDGFEAEHNWMRGSQASYSRATEAIHALCLQEGLSWDVITCVNRRNFPTLEAFKKHLISLGVTHWRIFTVVPMGRAVNEPELFLDREQFVSLMDFISRTRQEGRITLNFSCEGFLGRYEGKVRSNYYTCYAGTNVASVRNDGSISGCLSIRSNYDQGNIYRDDFWKVWEEGFQPYRDRRWMKSGECAHCRAWRFCQGGGMHLRTDDGDLLCCNYSGFLI